MNTLLTGVVSASLFCAACTENKSSTIYNVPSMNKVDLAVITTAIQEQYTTILKNHTTQESLVLRLRDQGATLILNVQKGKIVMAQLALRNPYPNSPDMAPTPYTDIHGDGTLDAYPADINTPPLSPLTYGNYVSLLTRFGIPAEVISKSE